MTRFIDVPALSHLVRARGTARFIAELAATLHEDFLRWEDFDKSARVGSHSARGVIELMPVADARRYASKYVNGHPGNTAQGLNTVMAFGVLADVATGYPLMLSELTVTTALRTAATSAMAARALARPDSRRMALIGNGAQSEFQALAFHTLLGITELSVFDVDAAATDKLVRHLAAWPHLQVRRAGSVADALAGADIVTTVTADKTRAAILRPEMIEPGMHINGVGGDCPGKTELHPEVLRGARVFVEFEPQTRLEGDIQQLEADFPVVELWRVLAGDVPGRQSARQVTVFDSVGFALEDYSALRYVYRLAQEHASARNLDLVPAAGDPKDLFRFTLDAAQVSPEMSPGMSPERQLAPGPRGMLDAGTPREYRDDTDSRLLAQLRSINQRAAFNRWCGLEVLTASPGCVESSMPWREEAGQYAGFLHAGVVAALIDTACGYAAATLVGPSVLAAHVAFNCLRPAVGERFTARAKVVKPGKTQVFTACELFAWAAGEEKLVATGETLLVLVPATAA